jgi:hypothetical protein
MSKLNPRKRMASKNDITGDSIASRLLSPEGRANWDTIFKKTPLKIDIDEDHNVVASQKYLVGSAAKCSECVMEILKASTCSADHNSTLLIERAGLNRCRVLPGTAEEYMELHPTDLLIFNASIFTLNEGRIWIGDLNITEDISKLKLVAQELKVDLYILCEHDSRHENMDKARIEKEAHLIVNYD